MAKTKNISTGKIALEDMPDALTEILTDFQRSSFDVRQNAVQAGAEVFKSFYWSRRQHQNGTNGKHAQKSGE